MDNQEPKEGMLLSDEELKNINNNMPLEAKYGDVFIEIARTQHLKTAKVVFEAYTEILDKLVDALSDYADEQYMDGIKSEIEALKSKYLEGK